MTTTTTTNNNTVAGAASAIAPATAADRDAVRHLLESVGLPVDDLEAEDVSLWLMPGAAGRPAGCVGLEVHGSHALLRSLAVADEARRTGLGAALVDHALDAARAAGAASAWALTREAAPWFLGRGWTIADRAAAPEDIRATRQFSGLCPASATLLVRPLAGE